MTPPIPDTDTPTTAPYDAQAPQGDRSAQDAPESASYDAQPQGDEDRASPDPRPGLSSEDAPETAPYDAQADEERPEIEIEGQPVLLDDAHPEGEGIPPPGDPTEETYLELNRAFRVFNQLLFDGKLGPCLITFRARGRTMGYFSPNRYVNADGRRTHEIALNPEYFGTSTLEYTLSVLVHEMVHQAQYEQRTAGRSGYHNKDFAKRMRAVGLVASSTGEPGGHEVGPQMCHYVEPGGRFLEVARTILDEGFRARWADRYVRRRAPQWVPPADNPHVAPPDARPRLSKKKAEDTGDPDEAAGETEGVQGPNEAERNGQPSGSDAETDDFGEAPGQGDLVFEIPLPGDLARPDRPPPVVMPGGQPALVDQHPEDFVVVQPKVSRRNKVKFTCPKCRDNAWGKVALQLRCGRCDVSFGFADPYDPQVVEHLAFGNSGQDANAEEKAPPSQEDLTRVHQGSASTRRQRPAQDRRRCGRNLMRHRSPRTRRSFGVRSGRC